MVHILPHPLHHSTLHVDLQTCWSKDSILRQVNYYLWYWAYARTACVCAHLHTVILQNYHAPARWSIQHGKALITLLLGERCTAITQRRCIMQSWVQYHETQPNTGTLCSCGFGIMELNNCYLLIWWASSALQLPYASITQCSTWFSITKPNIQCQ
jgi:hypothetical protein